MQRNDPPLCLPSLFQNSPAGCLSPFDFFIFPDGTVGKEPACYCGRPSGWESRVDWGCPALWLPRRPLMYWDWPLSAAVLRTPTRNPWRVPASPLYHRARASRHCWAQICFSACHSPWKQGRGWGEGVGFPPPSHHRDLKSTGAAHLLLRLPVCLTESELHSALAPSCVGKLGYASQVQFSQQRPL